MRLGPVRTYPGIDRQFHIQFYHRVRGIFHHVTRGCDKIVFGSFFDLEQ